MKTKTLILLFAIISPFFVNAQQIASKSNWSLNDCINYALGQNTQVRKSILTNLTNQVNKEQTVANKLPSVSASVRENFSWSNVENISTGSSAFSGTNSTSYSLSSSITLYNGARLNNLIKQAGLDMQSGNYDSETIKESVTISILNAYLQVLFTEEQVKNAERQIESTTEQLNLAQERLTLGIISQSDYLQVKSQLASEKLSLANAKSQFAISRVNLMQLMELPVNNEFAIVNPDLEENVNKNISPVAADVYAVALAIKPEIKSAEYSKESSAMNIKIAEAGFYPTISADAGLGTGYSNRSEAGYFSQLNDQISPSLGISMSIPIFQKNQIKTSVTKAEINYQNAELQELNTRNQLRKEIEQVCVDVVSAQSEFEASVEKFNSTEESYKLAEEKYKNGLINSIDFLYERTRYLAAESDLLQSKFNLLFSYKILDFYTGKPITI